MRIGGACPPQAARAGPHVGDAVDARAQADRAAPGRGLDVRGVDGAHAAVLELDLHADAADLDGQTRDDGAEADAHGLVEGLDRPDEDVAVLGNDDAVADGDRERAARALEARRPRDGRGVRVPADAQSVGVHRRLLHPGVERRAVVAGGERGVGLGAEGMEVVAHEVAREVDGAHALGLGVPLLGRGRVGVGVARGVAIGRGEHRSIDRTVDGEAEQAQRLAERGRHGRTLRRVESFFCTPSGYGVCAVLTLVAVPVRADRSTTLRRVWPRSGFRRTGLNNDENASGSATQTPPSDFEPPSLRPPPITVYKARRPRKGFGWKRAILWTFGTLLVIGIGTAGVTRLVRLRPAREGHDDHEQPGLQKVSKHLDLPIANKPVTVLVLGYDHRSWEKTTQSRSDTLMLMRLDPKRQSLTALSMPRDMHVEIPGHGLDKLNAAYSYGGADLALQTVRQTLNVKINYLITVDFTGFRRIVDHVGGVYTDVERRYYNKNGQAGSGDYSNIDMRAGYQKLMRRPGALVRALPPPGQRHLPDHAPAGVHARAQAQARPDDHRHELREPRQRRRRQRQDRSQFKHKPGPKTLIGFARALAQGAEVAHAAAQAARRPGRADRRSS